jgi:transposase InsO family protein
VKFAFVAVEKASFPVTILCNVLEVSRSGFYAWTERVPSARSLEDAKLRVHVAAAYELGRGNYGAPRIHRELRAAGLHVSRKRVVRLMGELGLKARRKRRFKATTDSNHAMPVAENVLDRKFEVDAPNVAWVTDITYVWTSEGWLYLAAILDLFSRRVVGFAMSERIDRALVLQALTAAVGRRAPNAGLLHHSDRGSQYASNDLFYNRQRRHSLRSREAAMKRS